jgi:hypothetical protein
VVSQTLARHFHAEIQELRKHWIPVFTGMTPRNAGKLFNAALGRDAFSVANKCAGVQAAETILAILPSAGQSPRMAGEITLAGPKREVYSSSFPKS